MVLAHFSSVSFRAYWCKKKLQLSQTLNKGSAGSALKKRHADKCRFKVKPYPFQFLYFLCCLIRNCLQPATVPWPGGWVPLVQSVNVCSSCYQWFNTIMNCIFYKNKKCDISLNIQTNTSCLDPEMNSGSFCEGNSFIFSNPLVIYHRLCCPLCFET